jgi:hypothetical protein
LAEHLLGFSVMSLERTLEEKRVISEEILATLGEGIFRQTIPLDNESAAALPALNLPPPLILTLAHHPPLAGLTGYFILAFRVSFLRTTVQVSKSVFQPE